MLYASKFGWGGRIRTSESRFQRPVSYRLTTPQSLIHEIRNPCPREAGEYRNSCLRRSGFAQAGETIFKPSQPPFYEWGKGEITAGRRFEFKVSFEFPYYILLTQRIQSSAGFGYSGGGRYPYTFHPFFSCLASPQTIHYFR